MKPRRSSFLVLGFLVAALAAWLVIRPHVAPVPENVSPRAQVNQPLPSTAPRAEPSASKGPGGIADANSPTPSPQVAAPADSLLPMASVAPTVRAPSTGTTNDPAMARSDAAPGNAIRVRRMVTDYHTLTGENPVGTNAEIMAAITGKNPRQAVLGPPEGMGLNGNGELLDDWGTPYFFHQLSKDVMEIHSAGPDKVMGTADDIVVR